MSANGSFNKKVNSATQHLKKDIEKSNEELNVRKYDKITVENINPRLVSLPEYGIRGLLLERAFELQREISKGIEKPFDKLIHATSGCCHSGGQKPITFVRQMLAAVTYPNLLETDYFPRDVKQKAALYLKSIPGGSIGSYSETPGTAIIRELAAKSIEEREGIKSNWKNVYLTNGASGAIFNLLNLISNSGNGKKVGVLTPIPEYPLYSTTIKILGMENIGYYLDEETQWSVNVKELEQIVDDLKSECVIKAIVVINPGNPTGHVLSKQNMKDIVKFSNNHGLMIIADEVYQCNIHKDVKFYSFKKIIHETNLNPNNITLASLMSVSKGYLGECGVRGGYVELDNMDPDVQKNFEKSLIMDLVPNSFGQAALYCLFNTPKPGEDSYQLFVQERMYIAEELKMKAKLVEEAFNSIDGFSCSPIYASLYAFPKVTFPLKVIEAAHLINEYPDYMFARELLENTGVSICAGSSFGQKSNTYHIRITLLSRIEVLKEMLDILKDFYKKFIAKFN